MLRGRPKLDIGLKFFAIKEKDIKDKKIGMEKTQEAFRERRHLYICNFGLWGVPLTIVKFKNGTTPSLLR